MATVTRGKTFNSGDTVYPADIHQLVDSATVTAIQTADIADGQITNAKVSASAAIDLSKLATGALPTAITVASANLVDGTIVNADINATAAIAGSKLADAGITAAKLNGVAKDGSGVDVAVGTAPIFGCRAWVNFDGTAGDTIGGEFRCTIRSSGNVSKVVRNSTGNYTLHFTTAMPDTHYAAVMYNNAATGTTATSFQNGLLGGMGDKTTTTMGVTSYTDTPSSGYRNSSMFDVIVFR